MSTYELSPEYDARASFHGKAVVRQVGPISTLMSYGRRVADYDSTTGQAYVYGTYSQTTLRHIKEFLKQHELRAESKQQILASYGIGVQR